MSSQQEASESRPGLGNWDIPEVVVEEGTNAYIMPVFRDWDHSSILSRALTGPSFTFPEVIAARMNAYLKQITEQGGQIIGFHRELLQDDGRSFVNLIIIKK